MRTRKFIAVLAVLFFGAGLSGTALAEKSPFYVGIKGGEMQVDDGAYENAGTSGLVLGYTFSRSNAGSLAIEGEYNTSSSEKYGASGKWEIDTIAAYLAYRTDADFYVKAKIGYLRQDISVDVAGASNMGTDSGYSFGAGGGWKIGKGFSLELEYTIVEQDIDFPSLGINYNF